MHEHIKLLQAQTIFIKSTWLTLNKQMRLASKNVEWLAIIIWYEIQLQSACVCKAIIINLIFSSIENQHDRKKQI